MKPFQESKYGRNRIELCLFARRGFIHQSAIRIKSMDELIDPSISPPHS